LNPDQLGGVRLDLTTKRGVGIGVDHFYTFPQGNGEAFAYARQGLSEYVLRVDHKQVLPAQSTLSVRSDIRQNNLFSLQPTTNTDISSILTRRTDHTDTTFNFSRRLLEGDFGTDNITANLLYNSTVAAGTLRTSLEYSSFGSGSSAVSTTTNQALWDRLQWTRPMGFTDLNLRVDKHFNLDEGDMTGAQFASGVERLPELSLVSTEKNLHLGFLQNFPSRFTLGWGVFNELPADTTLNRYRLEWQSNLNQLRRGSTIFTGSTAFRQTMYGDADTTAQYMYSANLTATTPLGKLTNVARYGRQGERGFTPFQFDTVYPYHTITDSVQYLTPNLRMYVTAGRDLERETWYDLTYRTFAQIGRSLSTSQSLAYDLNGHQWRDLVSQFSWYRQSQLTFNLGSRYNLHEHQLQRVSTEMEWVITPKWRMQWLGGYDGPTHQFTYNEFLVTRDLHCWDASLYYSGEQKYFYLYLRLKALNIPLPRFGIGQGGQVLDTTQGTVQ
ncbi:MAG TPA: hypothetical protein VGL77_19760, partial [Armatimonadota bacterium]